MTDEKFGGLVSRAYALFYPRDVSPLLRDIVEAGGDEVQRRLLGAVIKGRLNHLGVKRKPDELLSAAIDAALTTHPTPKGAK